MHGFLGHSTVVHMARTNFILCTCESSKYAVDFASLSKLFEIIYQNIRELGVRWQVPLLPKCASHHALVGFKWVETLATPESSFDLVSHTKGRERLLTECLLSIFLFVVLCIFCIH
jgi:hypothetical protein